MKSPVLAVFVLTLTAGAMSCSNDESNGTGGGGTSGASSSQGGSSASGSQSVLGGSSSSSKSSGGNSGSAGSSAGGQKSSSGGTTGGSSGSGGQSATGGKTGTGGGKAGGETGTAGATSSAPGGTATGGTSAPGGTTATGGQSTGGRTTGPMTGGSSAGATGGAGGGSTSGGSSGTDTGPKGGAASSPGCGKSPTMANGAGKIGSRNFMLRIPTGYDNKHPYPLVFAFHWQGGTMGEVDGGGSSGYTWSYYGLRELADKSTDHKMIFVAPDGNGGWPNSGGADLKFVDDLYKQITEDLCVDTTRVFSMGFSYGGGMTYEIACARAKTFRAAAVYAGAQLSGKCDGGKDPIAYIGFHSVSDNRCSYGGGEGLRDTFVSNNGCTKQTPPKPSGMTHVCTKYTGCKAGYPVEWCAFDGAGHSPAPVDGQSNDSGGGDKTWTKAEAWNFFTQF
jgi:poly(3-hydroxybutyrate) depolymerase